MSKPVTFDRIRPVALVVALIAFMIVCLGQSDAQARPDDKAVLSPLAFRVLDPSTPVRAADGRMHLAYELQVVNQSQAAVTITKVGTRAQNHVLGKALTGTALAARVRLNNGASGTTLASGTSAYIFMDAVYGVGRKTPRRINHGIALAYTDPVSGDTVKQRFSGVRSRVAKRPPVQIASPLRGGKWIAVSSCCTLNPHRGATLTIDGTVRAPERFAIDFVQLNAENTLFNGAITELSNWEFYGTPIHSVSRGKVVSVVNKYPEQVPGALPVGPTIQMAGGNHVVVSMGKGRYAFYAHLRKDSIRVKKGDRVRTGQVLGLLGNTGNTDGPHLHFHVMDSPSPLQSNGLPFVFKKFTGQGFITDANAVTTGATAVVKRKLIGPHRNQITLDNQIINFGN